MSHDIEILKQYLTENSIAPEGHLDEDIKNQNNNALFYAIYAIQNFSHNSKLIDKIRLLAQKRGAEDDDNDIRRNYENQLFEFHALYILIEKMNYNFIDFEVPSNKSHAKVNSNCDILLEKDHERYFVDAKQSSTQLMSETPNLKYNNLIDINNPLIPDILEKYIKRLVRDAEEKGCDFLALQIPKWDLPDLKIESLTNFLKKVSAEIENRGSKWVWLMKNIHITKLIFPKRLEYFEIEIASS